MIYDVIIIGGGLSGLVIAHGLISSNTTKRCSCVLLEASHRLGGRLVNATTNIPIDMGGAWIWSHHQPNIYNLITKQLQLQTFVQPDDPSSTRIVGGAVRMIETLAEQIVQQHHHRLISSSSSSSSSSNNNDFDPIRLNTQIVSCTLQKGSSSNRSGVTTKQSDDDDDKEEDFIQLTATDGTVYTSRKVVLAIPPKVIYETMTFHPPLSNTKNMAMQSCTTWMADVTKVALVYKNKFWDSYSSNMGLPKALDQPAFQVYDSSTNDNSIPALTFFVHVPSSSNDDDSEMTQINDDTILAKQVAKQMADVWKRMGRIEYAKNVLLYNTYHIYRWPNNKYISSGTVIHTEHINPHPIPILALSKPEWDDTLYFASTESDTVSPGVMEGAVNAAKRVLQSLLQQ